MLTLVGSNGTGIPSFTDRTLRNPYLAIGDTAQKEMTGCDVANRLSGLADNETTEPCQRSTPQPLYLQHCADVFQHVIVSLKEGFVSIVSPEVLWRGEGDGKEVGPLENQVTLRVEIAKSSEVQVLTWSSFTITSFSLIASVSLLCWIIRIMLSNTLENYLQLFAWWRDSFADYSVDIPIH